MMSSYDMFSRGGVVNKFQHPFVKIPPETNYIYGD